MVASALGAGGGQRRSVRARVPRASWALARLRLCRCGQGHVARRPAEEDMPLRGAPDPSAGPSRAAPTRAAAEPDGTGEPQARELGQRTPHGGQVLSLSNSRPRAPGPTSFCRSSLLAHTLGWLTYSGPRTSWGSDGSPGPAQLPVTATPGPTMGSALSAELLGSARRCWPHSGPGFQV